MQVQRTFTIFIVLLMLTGAVGINPSPVQAVQEALSTSQLQFIMGGIALAFRTNGSDATTDSNALRGEFLGANANQPLYLRTGIDDITTFLEKCPTNDPFYSKIRSDFTIARDGVFVGDIPCSEPISSIPLDQYTYELIILQALRTIYYMYTGIPNSLPWTSMSLYDWMASVVDGINITSNIGQMYCCDLIDGKILISLGLNPGNREYTRDWTNYNGGGIAPLIDLIAHEARHADANSPGHVCGCVAVPDTVCGCDEFYNLSNLGAYGVQYWLHQSWLTGYLDIGIGCNPKRSLEYATMHYAWVEAYRNRIVQYIPPIDMPDPPYGGPCFAPLTISGNVGVSGATLSYTDGIPKTVTADGSGNYLFTVSYNWTGTVTPSKINYTFLPDSRTYTNVVENQTDQNYTAIFTETVSTPSTPAGPPSGAIGTPYTYSTGGSTSSYGHSVEYQFDWKGDGTNLSSWGGATQSKIWTSAGIYNVRARARCTLDTSVISGWSGLLQVTIALSRSTRTLPLCYTPSLPLTVAIAINPGAATQAYSAEDSPPNGWTVSNINENGQWDDVNKKVKWGPFFDSNNRTLTYKVTPPSDATGAKTFSGTASFDGTNVAISGDLTLDGCSTAPITLQSPSDGTTFGACSLYSLPTFSWTAGETFRSYEIQFSPDESFSSAPVKVKVSGAITQITMTSSTWKRVLSIPGGTVYWRIIGKQANRKTATSEVYSFIIEPSKPVTNQTISPTSETSLPALSWENSCNTKFKVWFGRDEQFTRKTAFVFNIRNPNDNEGEFTKVLTLGQWMAIRRMVRDIIGSTIYWYVESWDSLGRYSKTNLMNFVLTE